MVHVEFIGTPGSGKSTIRSLLLESLNSHEISCLSMEQALLSSLKLNVDGILFKCFLNILPENLALKYAPLIFTRSALRYTAQNAFLSTHGKPVATFLSNNFFLQAPANEKEAVLSRFLLTASQYHLIREHIAEKMPVLFDEGFLQRSASLFVSTGKSSLPDTTFFSAYLDTIPLPDIVLYLNSDIKICLDRIMNRPKGLPDRLAGKPHKEIMSYIEIFDRCIQCIADLADEKGFHISRIKNNGRPEEVVSYLQQIIRQQNMNPCQT
ncbi:MAG TPA: hypothetical protein PLM29_00375 [Deltaproteobacteria bacterium]|nr:hypothetical protein [Deltaproteobacteria bacterium]